MADWSSVFEASGDEDGDWDRCEAEESRTTTLQYLQNYNPIVAYFFTVNYVLGVGCLGIPYAFQQSGIVLASIVILFVTFVSYFTVMFVADASYKGMMNKRSSKIQNPFLPPHSQSRGPINQLSSLLRAAGTDRSLSTPATKSSILDHVGKARTVRPRFDSYDSIGEGDDSEQAGELEVTVLAEEFLGHWGKGE